MDQQAILQSAKNLQAALARYAPVNDSAAALQKVLTPFVESALAGHIQQPLQRQRIPGRRTFDDTDARTLPGLEEAYARFKTEVTGGEPEFQRVYREEHGIAR